MSWTLKVVDGDVVRLHTNVGYEQVTGKDKLKQDVLMTLSTSVRSDTGIGTGLGQVIGDRTDKEPDNVYSTPAMFKFQTLVRNGLSRLKYNQRNFFFNRRTPYEMLEDFSPVQVWATDDPRVYRWRVDLYTMGNLPNFAAGGILT